ncbi:MAG: hypothetical protein CMF29_04930 [Kiritimatiellaceae bacterium]|nr:hypothetical protein [Kiritimatiellaceae bacterium]
MGTVVYLHPDYQGCQLMEKLKRARESAGVSVTELAKQLGIAPAAYRRYERGEVYPKINVCAQICKIIGKSIGEVFDDEYEPPKSVDLSYRARPGQTLYIKVEVDENGSIVPVLGNDEPKIVNGS